MKLFRERDKGGLGIVAFYLGSGVYWFWCHDTGALIAMIIIDDTVVQFYEMLKHFKSLFYLKYFEVFFKVD